MEHFGADPRPIIQLCREEVARCDLVILIQAWRRGSVPTVEEGGDGTTSITGFEIRAADGGNDERRRVPVLAFLADDEWPGKLWEMDADARGWVDGFRRGLNRSAKFFKWESGTDLPAFRSLVREQLALHLSRRPAGPAPPVAAVEIRRIPAEPASLPSEPYPLLGPYDHPRTFAGRETEIEKLIALVAGPQLILSLYAPSGAGKSSLLLAGLTPRLRADGYIVSVERAPADPGLARRLLGDVLELDASQLPADGDDDLPARFAELTAYARARAGKPVVFVVDQLDDVLRSAAKKTAAMATLGVLIAATAQRLPGSQAFPCKWILSYRHEFHGTVRAWLEDVLAIPRAEKRRGIGLLPWDLSDAQKSTDWPVPVFGRIAGEQSTGESPLLPFTRAILAPLEVQSGGARRYPYVMAQTDAKRLAEAFAEMRRQQPETPLVPELQIVLNDLLRRAREHVPKGEPPWPLVVADGEDLSAQIRFALRDHIESALNRSFPPLNDGAGGRQSRTRALLALRALADARGRRAERIPQDELAKRIGGDAAAVLDKLSAADTRLIVIDEEGRCALSHDCLAEALTLVVDSPAARGSLSVDQRLIDLQRIIGQKAALHHADASDTSAFILSRQQRDMVRDNRDLLLDSDVRSNWWMAVEDHYRRRRTKRIVSAGVAAVLAAAAGVLGWYGYRAWDRQQLREGLVTAALSSKPRFGELVRLSNKHPYDWSVVSEAFDPQVINPDLFPRALHDKQVNLDDVVSVIERIYRVFVRSRKLFGAMSFALEEVRLRAQGNADLARRAQNLSVELRKAFVEVQQTNDRRFEPPPPTPDKDTLNPWHPITPGSPNLRPFSIQEHEVTNDEYHRFDPTHESKSGGHYPVTEVSWYESAAYAAWLGASLPSEAEWRRAAFGEAGRSYPWIAGTLDRTRAVFEQAAEGPQPVGSRPDGRTPEGVDDMAGNVAEWCRDEASATQTADLVIDRIVRGGSYLTNGSDLGVVREGRWGTQPFHDVGFRLVSPRFDR